MKFLTRRLAVKALAAAVAMGGLSVAVAQDVKRAKLGHSFTDSHPRAIAMKQFATAVEQATGGKVVFDVYGNSTLGSEEKMLIAVQSGVQDVYLGALSPVAARKKELQIFDFPFLFGSDAEAAYVLDGPVGRRMLDGLADMSMHGLVWAGGAFRNLSNSKRPVGTMADMKGLKVRVMQSPMALASFNAMGMNAVPMAFTEVYPALEIKALDGYEHPVVDMYANKMFEVQKYLTITNNVYTPVALVASKKWWSGLTPEQQRTVQRVAEETRTFERAEELRQAADVVAQLRSKGMAVTEMPPAELEKIRASVQPVIDKNADVIGAEFVRSFYAELKKFRAGR
ncbi:MAG: DctP family TRAP transporter solute-binding subunit [Burkholderiales bacterium]|nr:DctP family TRAP transporter solute-binding subunit [Burkholderiales bacterium]